MSFGFRVIRQDWSPDFTQRDISEVSLNKGDVSVVNYGANPATAGASLRSRDVAAWLADADPDEVRRIISKLPAVDDRAADLDLYRLRALAAAKMLDI